MIEDHGDAEARAARGSSTGQESHAVRHAPLGTARRWRRWRAAFHRVGFEQIELQLLRHEGGVISARRPVRSSGRIGSPDLAVGRLPTRMGSRDAAARTPGIDV